MLPTLFGSLFPGFVAKVIHQVAGTERGDDIMKKDSPIISAVIHVAQPLIVKAAQGSTVGKLVDNK